jgi:excisionase family DNA binding protein
MSIASLVPPPASPERPHLLEVAHVAHRLFSSQEYVRELIRKGKLTAIQFARRYRVDPLDLEAFIDAHRVGPMSRSTDKFCCPQCGAWRSKVVDSRPDTQGLRYVRWRRCMGCGQLFETVEEPHGTHVGERYGPSVRR